MNHTFHRLRPVTHDERERRDIQMTDILTEAIDVHVHTAPDLIDRNQTDLELARAAIDAGMRGVVVKSHVVPTVGRVDLVNKAVGAEILHGGVALNGSVGGINVNAAETALELGAKVVWLPTAWSTNHAQQWREAGESHFVGQRIPGPDEELLVAHNGEVTERVAEIVDLVGSYDATLGTGHASAPEIEAVVAACADAGVRVVVNHPFFHVVDLSVDQQRRLAEMGAIIEYCAYSVRSTEGHTVERVADAVEEIGVHSCLLASDLGQQENPPIEGFREFACGTHKAGVSEAAMRTLIVNNPAGVLGLSP